MRTPKLLTLSLAGLAASAMIASTPLFARDFDDHRHHAGYHRDHDWRHDARRFDHRRVIVERPVHVHRRPVVVERPVYVRERVVYREPAPYYEAPAPQASIGAVVGAAIGTMIENRMGN